MRPLSASELLSVWEACLHLPLLERSLHLLSVACSLPDVSGAARMSIGERDARLLRLREWLFGSQMKNMARCPSCLEQMEWESDTTAFHLQSFHQPEPEVRVFQLDAEGYQIRYRLPNSEDMRRAMNDVAYAERPHQLLAECVVEWDTTGKAERGHAEDLPQEVFEQLSRQMELQDPQANITFQMNCPVCRHTWTSTFDIQSYLWAEIDVWAKHTLREVYLLASNFGWSERDILNMHSLRRQLYLEMIGS